MVLKEVTSLEGHLKIHAPMTRTIRPKHMKDIGRVIALYEHAVHGRGEQGEPRGFIEGDATEVPTGIAEKAEENVEELLEEKTAAESIQRVKYDYARREGRRNQEEKNPVEYCIELGKLAVLLVHVAIVLAGHFMLSFVKLAINVIYEQFSVRRLLRPGVVIGQVYLIVQSLTITTDAFVERMIRISEQLKIALPSMPWLHTLWDGIYQVEDF